MTQRPTSQLLREAWAGYNGNVSDDEARAVEDALASLEETEMDEARYGASFDDGEGLECPTCGRRTDDPRLAPRPCCGDYENTLCLVHEAGACYDGCLWAYANGDEPTRTQLESARTKLTGELHVAEQLGATLYDVTALGTKLLAVQAALGEAYDVDVQSNRHVDADGRLR